MEERKTMVVFKDKFVLSDFGLPESLWDNVGEDLEFSPDELHVGVGVRKETGGCQVHSLYRRNCYLMLCSRGKRYRTRFTTREDAKEFGKQIAKTFCESPEMRRDFLTPRRAAASVSVKFSSPQGRFYHEASLWFGKMCIRLTCNCFADKNLDRESFLEILNECPPWLERKKLIMESGSLFAALKLLGNFRGKKGGVCKHKNALRLYALDYICDKLKGKIDKLVDVLPGEGEHVEIINQMKEVLTMREKADGASRLMACGDAHFPFVDKQAIEALESVIKTWRPDYLVLLGDIVDFYQLSRFNKDPGRTLKLQEDIDMATEFLGNIRSLVGGDCKIFFIEGNHEHRLRKWLNNHPEVASLKSLSLPHLLQLEKWDMNYVSITETLKIGDFVFVHGDYNRKWSGQSGRAHLERFLKSGISGHSHRLNVFFWRGMDSVLTWGEAGCLCDLEPEWFRAPDWHHGCIIGEYMKGGWAIQPVPFRGKTPVLPIEPASKPSIKIESE
jgi:metallophosphoesterase superfamily enzyme